MDNLSERFTSARSPAGSFGGVYSFRFMSIYEKGGIDIKDLLKNYIRGILIIIWTPILLVALTFFAIDKKFKKGRKNHGIKN